MFSDEDLALLNRPLYAFLTVAPRGGRWPAPRPVWFELTDDGALQLFSLATSPKVDRLREQPRASVVVSAPNGEPEHWVSVEGSATLHADGAFELAARLGDRYWVRRDDALLEEGEVSEVDQASLPAYDPAGEQPVPNSTPEP